MPPKRRTRRSADNPTPLVTQASPQAPITTRGLRDTRPKARRSRHPANSNQADSDRSPEPDSRSKSRRRARSKPEPKSKSNLPANLPRARRLSPREERPPAVPNRYELRSVEQTFAALKSPPPPPSLAPRASKKKNPALLQKASPKSALPSTRRETYTISASHIATRSISSAAHQDPSVSNSSEEENSTTSDCWYRSRGYLPPREAMPPKNLLRSHNASEARSGTQNSRTSNTSNQKEELRIVYSSQMNFLEGLRRRNIVFEASTDHNKSTSALALGECLCTTTKEEENNWQVDLQECQISGEATFQRTIMMEILNRHKLGDCLKYSCEATWTYLTVSFKSSAVIDERRRTHLSHLMQYICPESSKEYKVDRAFHFFSVEAKNAQIASKNNTALRQNFHVATQALHNMYMLMRLAEMEDTFFEDVRFFSTTAASSGFHIRSHRAVKVDPAIWIENGYPLGFDFEEVF